MNVRLYRSLYWANQGLINAAREIREMSRQPGLPRTELQDLESIIEETRVAMNSLVGERIGRPEAGRASRLQVIRFPGKRANPSLTPETNGSTHGRKR